MIQAASKITFTKVDDGKVYSVKWLLNGVAQEKLNYTAVKGLETAELQALFFLNGKAYTAAKAVIGCYDAAGNLLGSPIESSDTSGSVIDGGNLYLSKDTLSINCKFYDNRNELCDTSLPVGKDGDKGDNYQPNLLKGANTALQSTAYLIGQYAWDGSKPAVGTLCTLTVCYKVDSADTVIKVFQDSGTQMVATLKSKTEVIESYQWTYKAKSGLSAAQLLQFSFFHETSGASSYASGTYVKWAVVTMGANAAATAWVPAASEMVGQKGDTPPMYSLNATAGNNDIGNNSRISFNGKQLVTSNSRGHTIYFLRGGVSPSVVFTKSYDTYRTPSLATDMATYLTSNDASAYNDCVLVIIGFDALSVNDDLRNALKKYGYGGDSLLYNVSQSRTSFVFIGQKGMPEGTAYYKMSKTEKVSLTASVSNGVLIGMGHKGDKGDTGPAGKDGSDATVETTYSLLASRRSVTSAPEKVISGTTKTYKMRLYGKLTYDYVIVHNASGDTRTSTLEMINSHNMRLKWQMQLMPFRASAKGADVWAAERDFPMRADDASSYPGIQNIVVDFENTTTYIEDFGYTGYYPVFMRVQLYDATNTTKIYAEDTFSIPFRTTALLDFDPTTGVIRGTTTDSFGNISDLQQKADSITAQVNQTSAQLTDGNFTIKAGTTHWVDNNDNEVATIRNDGSINFEKLRSNNGDFKVDSFGNLLTGVQSVATPYYIVEDRSNIICQDDCTIILPNDEEYIGRRIMILATARMNSAGVYVKADNSAITSSANFPAIRVCTGRTFCKCLYAKGVGSTTTTPAIINDASGEPLIGLQYMRGGFAQSNTGGYMGVRNLLLRNGYVELLGVPYSVVTSTTAEQLYRAPSGSVLSGEQGTVVMHRDSSGRIMDEAEGGTAQYTAYTLDGNKYPTYPKDGTNGTVTITATTAANSTTWTMCENLCAWVIINCQANSKTMSKI